MSLLKTDKDLKREEESLIKLTSKNKKDVDLAKKIISNGKKAKIDEKTHDENRILLSQINEFLGENKKTLSREEQAKLSRLAVDLSKQEELLTETETAAKANEEFSMTEAKRTENQSLSKRLKRLTSKGTSFLEHAAYLAGVAFQVYTNIPSIFGDGIRKPSEHKPSKGQLMAMLHGLAEGGKNLLAQIFGNSKPQKINFDEVYNAALDKWKEYIQLDRPVLQMSNKITSLSLDSLKSSDNKDSLKPFVELSLLNDYAYQVQALKYELAKKDSYLYKELNNEIKANIHGSNQTFFKCFTNEKGFLDLNKSLIDFYKTGFCTIDNGTITIKDEHRAVLLGGIKDEHLRKDFFQYFDLLVQEYLCDKQLFDTFKSFTGKINNCAEILDLSFISRDRFHIFPSLCKNDTTDIYEQLNVLNSEATGLAFITPIEPDRRVGYRLLSDDNVCDIVKIGESYEGDSNRQLCVLAVLVFLSFKIYLRRVKHTHINQFIEYNYKIKQKYSGYIEEVKKNKKGIYTEEELEAVSILENTKNFTVEEAKRFESLIGDSKILGNTLRDYYQDRLISQNIDNTTSVILDGATYQKEYNIESTRSLEESEVNSYIENAEIMAYNNLTDEAYSESEMALRKATEERTAELRKATTKPAVDEINIDNNVENKEILNGKIPYGIPMPNMRVPSTNENNDFIKEGR